MKHNDFYPSGKDVDEYLTLAGAQRLCSRVREYWRRRGYYGLVIEPVLIKHQDHPYYGVQSNMVNGLPPREPPNEHKGMGQ